MRGLCKMKEIVTFYLCGKKYGVEVSQMQGIENDTELSQTPDMPDCLQGFVSVRGEVIPVVDIKKRLALPAVSATADTKLLVLRTSYGKLAFVADSVSKMVRVEGEEIQSFPPLMQTEETSYVDFIVKNEGALILVINSNRIISKEESEAIQKVLDDMETGGNND